MSENKPSSSVTLLFLNSPTFDTFTPERGLPETSFTMPFIISCAIRLTEEMNNKPIVNNNLFIIKSFN